MWCGRVKKRWWFEWTPVWLLADLADSDVCNNVPQQKLKCSWSDSPFLSILLPSGISWTDTFMVTIVWEVSLGWFPGQCPMECHPVCVQWLPFNRKCTQQERLSFDFPWTGLNLPFRKRGGEGNANEGKIRLGAQCRRTVLPYVLYLAGLVILFIMPSVYIPYFPQTAPPGQPVRWCEWRICKVVWMGLL